MSDIVHDQDRHRFALRLDSQEAVIDYVPFGTGTMNLTHTFVPREFRGRGIAGRLTRHVLDYARAEGLKVVPTCPYIAAFIGRNPSYRDLVALKRRRPPKGGRRLRLTRRVAISRRSCSGLLHPGCADGSRCGSNGAA